MINLETIIEESIWNIEEKTSIRKAIFRCDGKKVTRNLFILGDSDRRNNKIDTIDIENAKIEIDVSKINNCSTEEIINFLNEKAKIWDPISIFEKNINSEIPFFENPIITTNNTINGTLAKSS